MTMQGRAFEDRTTAHKWATRQRPVKTDRIVMACDGCPEVHRSRRRPPRWGDVARRLAATLGVNPTETRAALAAALAAERASRDPQQVVNERYGGGRRGTPTRGRVGHQE